MNEFQLCRYCGKNNALHASLKFASRNQCRPCNQERSNRDTAITAWRCARWHGKDIGGSANLPDSLGDQDEFKRHIESQFYTPHMTWDTYGKGRGKWQIDHIIPRSDFSGDIGDKNEVERIFGLANLQPLWYRHNMAKSNLEPQATMLAIDTDTLMWSLEDLANEDTRFRYAVLVQQLLQGTHQRIQQLSREIRGAE